MCVNLLSEIIVQPSSTEEASLPTAEELRGEVPESFKILFPQIRHLLVQNSNVQTTLAQITLDSVSKHPGKELIVCIYAVS